MAKNDPKSGQNWPKLKISHNLANFYPTMCTCSCTHAHAHMYTCPHAHMHIHMQTLTCTDMHTCTYTHHTLGCLIKHELLKLQEFTHSQQSHGCPKTTEEVSGFSLIPTYESWHCQATNLCQFRVNHDLVISQPKIILQCAFWAYICCFVTLDISSFMIYSQKVTPSH